MVCNDFVKKVFYKAMLERGAGRERPPGRALYGNTETGGKRGGCFCAFEIQLPTDCHREHISRSELSPIWHYFVCNLLIFKGVGFKTGLCS